MENMKAEATLKWAISKTPAFFHRGPKHRIFTKGNRHVYNRNFSTFFLTNGEERGTMKKMP